jgi:hypothetical protein
MWPRMNLPAPDLRELLGRLVEDLVQRAPGGPLANAGDPRAIDEADWAEWVQVSAEPLEAAAEIFRRVSTGEV